MYNYISITPGTRFIQALLSKVKSLIVNSLPVYTAVKNVLLVYYILIFIFILTLMAIIYSIYRRYLCSYNFRRTVK